MTTDIRFPLHADSPPVFLMFEIDEIIPFIVFFILFLPAKNFLWVGLLLGFQASKIYIKIKKEMPNALFFHLMWMWGVIQPKISNKKIRPLPGYITAFIE